MIEHEAEIYSKPARTWFQTARDKAAAAARTKEGVEEASLVAKPAAKTRSVRKAEMKQKARAEAKEKKRVNEPMEETGAIKGTVRALKSKERELRQAGITAGKASKGAVAAVMGGGVKKRKAPAKKVRRGRCRLCVGLGWMDGSRGGGSRGDGNPNITW